MKLLGASMVALAMFTVSAAADAPVKLTGTKAKDVLRALKQAGVKPVHAKAKWTFKAQSIKCTAYYESEDGLGDYTCSVDKLELKTAAAYVLETTFSGAGVAEDSGMGKSHLDVSALICVDDQDATGGADAMYTCTFTATLGQ